MVGLVYITHGRFTFWDFSTISTACGHGCIRNHLGLGLGFNGVNLSFRRMGGLLIELEFEVWLLL